MEKSLPELTPERLEEICLLAEEAARNYVLSRFPAKRVENLNVIVETSVEEQLNITVEVELTLSPLMREADAKKVADEAVKHAFAEVEKYLRELK
ncbi:DUF3194 domain-containing protein [Candidatus Bathyarchaeota archaeon]|nr:DUF3194 domain-containing protein [Candidatus Bathyarchaeota archaeon]